MLTSVTGINWGDEGKGRIVDLLTEKADYVVRYQGGNNAGHTVVTDQGKFVLNLLPSGILHPTAVCVLGNGMVIDPDHLRHEIAMMQYMKVKVDASNLKISDKATICMPFHVRQDVLEEERLSKTGSAFGSTRRGIAYAYGDKYMKKTLRMGDLLELDAPSVQHRLKVIIDSKNLVLENVYNQEPLSYDEIMEWCRSQAEFFKDYICDVGTLLGAAAGQGKNILFEAQLGALRDIDYGIYPFTSSSNTIASYAPIGAGNEKLRESGGEFGAATGRPRRVGPFDAVASRYGIRCQKAQDIALTKLDVLGAFDKIPVITGYRLHGVLLDSFPTDSRLEEAEPVIEELPGWECDISGCRSWKDLPENPIYLVSTGAERDAYLLRE